MSTERHDVVRLTLHGCSHRPKVSAIASPAKGERFKCYTCRVDRIVMGVVTTWAGAVLNCLQCKWRLENGGRYGKKRLQALGLRHANTRLHQVAVLHDGQQDVIKPQSFTQPFLVDDLLLP